jgi:hypothetical protein
LEARHFRPRKLDFESLIAVLVREHRTMESGLARAKEAAIEHDFAVVSSELKALDPIFKQHIADEESQILRLLIGELGREGAAEEIRVFQQHRPIHRLMELISELASKRESELEGEQTRLNELFLEHTTLEEGGAFPKSLRVFREKHRERTSRFPRPHNT